MNKDKDKDKDKVEISIQEEIESEIFLHNKKINITGTVKETIKTAKIASSCGEVYYVESYHTYQGDERMKNMAFAIKPYKGFYDKKELANIRIGMPAEPNLEIYMYKPEVVQHFIDNSYKSIYFYSRGMCRKNNEERKNFSFEDKIKDWSLNSKTPVIIDHGEGMMFDVKGNVIHMAVFCDYGFSKISEGRWDLHKLAKAMMSDDRCIVLFNNFEKHMRGKESELFDFSKHKAETIESAIFNIPHHNQDKGKKESIRFILKPDPDVFEAAWQEAQKGHRYPSGFYKEKILNLFLDDYKKTDCYLPFKRKKTKTINKP